MSWGPRSPRREFLGVQGQTVEKRTTARCSAKKTRQMSLTPLVSHLSTYRCLPTCASSHGCGCSQDSAFQSRVPLLISGRRRRRRSAPPQAQKAAISQGMSDLLVSACRCGQKGVKIGAAQQRASQNRLFSFVSETRGAAQKIRLIFLCLCFK